MSPNKLVSYLVGKGLIDLKNFNISVLVEFDYPDYDKYEGKELKEYIKTNYPDKVIDKYDKV